MLNAEMAKGLAAMFVEMLENEAATTKRVLAAVPEGRLDFKLGDKGKTARELMWHIVTSEAWFGEGVVNGDFAMEGAEEAAPATVAGIVAAYQARIPSVLERVKRMTGEQLARPVDFFGVYNLPAVMYLNFWNVHSVHHRGQLSTYLRAMNARVPSIYGGSADEPFSTTAQG